VDFPGRKYRMLETKEILGRNSLINLNDYKHERNSSEVKERQNSLAPASRLMMQGLQRKVKVFFQSTGVRQLECGLGHFAT